jgi:uncharacterized coiled-coil protein SlyX
MSLEKRLQEQRQKIEELRKQLARDTVGPEDLRLADDAHGERVAEVEARLARLEAGRRACVERYDREIAAQRAFLSELRGGTGRPPGGGEPGANGNGDDGGRWRRSLGTR